MASAQESSTPPRTGSDGRTTPLGAVPPRPPDGAPLSSARPPAAPDELSPGFRDRYTLLRVLGEGGFGVVYLAQDRVLKQKVAIKVLKLTGADERSMKRFIFEARTAANLRHTNIVNVFDMAKTEDGIQQVMEYYPGGTLKDRLESYGKLPPRQALEITLKILDGLGFAHARGIVHRDIKPANIFFAEDGSIKIGDFGLCASFETHDHTITGEIMGTPLYVAPEQMEDAKDVDPRCDIYSVGMTLYHMLTGERPNVIDLSLISAECRALITRSTARDRNRRLNSCDEFRSMILNVLPLVGDGDGDAKSDPKSVFALADDSASVFVGALSPAAAPDRTRDGSAMSSVATIGLSVGTAVLAVLVTLGVVFAYLAFSDRGSSPAPASVAAASPHQPAAPPGDPAPSGAGEAQPAAAVPAGPETSVPEPAPVVTPASTPTPAPTPPPMFAPDAGAQGAGVAPADRGAWSTSFAPTQGGTQDQAPPSPFTAGQQPAGQDMNPFQGAAQQQGGGQSLGPGDPLPGAGSGIGSFLDTRNSVPIRQIFGLLAQYFAAPDQPQGEQALNQAMEMIEGGGGVDIRNPVFPYLMGRIMEAAEQNAEARAEYRKVRERYPAFLTSHEATMSELLRVLGLAEPTGPFREFLYGAPNPALLR